MPNSTANEVAGALSYDSRWLAYASDESGRYEVYVRSFRGSGGQRKISTNSGTAPRWRRDGHELFYLAADGTLMAVTVESSGASFTTLGLGSTLPVGLAAVWSHLTMR